jgi:hypothetical protein
VAFDYPWPGFNSTTTTKPTAEPTSTAGVGTSTNSGNGDGSLSLGAKIGIGVAVAVVIVIILGWLSCLLYRRGLAAGRAEVEAKQRNAWSSMLWKGKPELDGESSQVHEMCNRSHVAELGSSTHGDDQRVLVELNAEPYREKVISNRQLGM